MSSVSKPHKEYLEYQSQWKLCRDLSEGQCAVHAAKDTYLPRLRSERDDEYKARIMRTPLYNAFWRTVAGLNGMMFKKPPIIEAPASMQPLIDDADLSGCSLETLAKEISEECLVIGRIGVMVDFPQAMTEGMTAAQVSSLNLRPYLKLYEAESIINWKTGRVNNANVLTQVVLAEEEEIQLNEFESKCETRYRVLDLFDGAYRQRVFKVNGKGQDELISESFPLMNGSAMYFIPFYFIGAESLTPDADAPTLIDLADLNIAHYRVTADYEHGCHFTGLPTPIITGYQKQDENEKLYIGSSIIYTLSDPQAKAFYLEFSGQGLSALETNLNRKEQQMAVMGARLLAQDKKMVESAETASIHRSGENSILAAIARNVSEGLTKAFQVMAIWAGYTDQVSIEINRDFINIPLSYQELTALVQAWQSGGISQETLFFNLKSGEIYPDDLTFEEEQARIDVSGTGLLTLPQQQVTQ